MYAMSTSVARRLTAGLAILALFLAFPGSVGATITGGCTGEGHATSSGSVDLTTATVWHLKSDETASGVAKSPVQMRSATISAYALGLAIPIASGTGNGESTGTVDNVDLSTFGALGKVFLVAGSATGLGECSGQILIILDDVDALFTLLGGGGLGLAILGLAAVIMASRSGGGCLTRVFGFLFGGLGALGLSLSLEQFQLIDPKTPVGLAIVVVGAVVGFVLAGRFGPGGETPPGPSARPAGTPPASPPPASETQSFVDDVAAPAVDAPIDEPPPSKGEYPSGGVGGGTAN
jgi:hypothetical protein